MNLKGDHRMNTQPIYTADDTCRLLHINRPTLDALEHSDDPLPYFTIEGGEYGVHLFAASCIDAWAARQTERQAAERAEIGG